MGELCRTVKISHSLVEREYKDRQRRYLKNAPRRRDSASFARPPVHDHRRERRA
jgi:hypothetical protein